MQLPRISPWPVAAVLVAVLAGGVATTVTRSNDTPASAAAPAPSPRAPATSAGPASPSPAASPTTTTPTVAATPVDPAYVDLAASILTPPPAYSLVTADGTGPVSLETAAALDGGGRLSTTGLRALGFQRGFARQWQGEQGILVVLAYRFSTAEGAARYVATAREVRQQDGTYTVASSSKVPGGVLLTGNTGTGPTAVVLFAVGRTAYAVGLVGPGASTPEQVELLAATQYAAASTGAEASAAAESASAAAESASARPSPTG